MPYIEDEQLTALYKEIETLSDEKIEIENELTEVENDYKKLKKESKLITILLTILVIGTTVTALYFFSKTKEKVNIEAIKTEAVEEYKENLAELQESSGYDENNEPETDAEYEDEDNKEILSSKSTDVETINNNAKGKKIYSVQIAALEERKVPLISANLISTSKVNEEDEFYKFSIGLFSTLEEAQVFRRELVKIGFEDVFVASYIDGRRQQIENP